MSGGYLKIGVLKMLSSEPMSGYSLMKKAAGLYGSKPSAGSIYPLLTELQAEGMVSSQKDGRRIIYKITAKGRKLVRELLKEKKEVIIQNMELARKIGALTGPRHVRPILRFFAAVEDRPAQLVRLFDSLSGVQEELVAYMKSEQYNEKKAKAVLKRASDELKRLNNGS